MKRTESIKIRLSEEEHRQLKSLAGARGISALLRSRALGADIREERREKLLILAELARCRNVLFKIALIAEGKEPADHVETIERLVLLERELGKLEPQ